MNQPAVHSSHTTGYTLLAVWLTCATVTLLGKAIPWETPVTVVKAEEPPAAEMLDIALSDTDDIATGEEAAPAPAGEPETASEMEPPPMQEIPSVEEAPPLIAVAEPSPQIALPKPVPAPSRIVPREQAESGNRTNRPATTPPAPRRASGGQRTDGGSPASGSPGVSGRSTGVQTLTFGLGEGRQPAPPYPSAAKLSGQEGTVVVRLSVDANGRVVSADAVRPCQWPSLNQSALRTVRSRWRFKSGAARTYQISIRFQLQ